MAAESSDAVKGQQQLKPITVMSHYLTTNQKKIEERNRLYIW
jgi:hypothetical protein